MLSIFVAVILTVLSKDIGTHFPPPIITWKAVCCGTVGGRGDGVMLGRYLLNCTAYCESTSS